MEETSLIEVKSDKKQESKQESRNIRVVIGKEVFSGITWSVGNKELAAWTTNEDDFPDFLGKIEEGEPVDGESLSLPKDLCHMYFGRSNRSIRWVPLRGEECDELARDAFVRASRGDDVYVTVWLASFLGKREVLGLDDAERYETLGYVLLSEVESDTLQKFAELNLHIESFLE